MKYLLHLFLLLPFVFAGCNGDNNPQGRVAVRGEVTLDGKPLEFGNITFSSLPELTPVVSTGATIKNGKFSLTAKNGLIPDQEYLVQFRAVEEIPGARKTDDPMERVPTRNLIPSKYGVKSKETVTATKKSPNVFKFDLTSDK